MKTLHSVWLEIEHLEIVQFRELFSLEIPCFAQLWEFHSILVLLHHGIVSFNK